MDRIYEYTPLKLELLTTLEDESINLKASAPTVQTRLDQVKDNIEDLDDQINILKDKLDNISQTINNVDYQAAVAADTLQVKLRKSIVAVEALDEEENIIPDLSIDYAELLDPEDEYYGFSNGSAWFILES